MSWWRRHRLALAASVPLLVVAVWLSAGDDATTWLGLESPLVPVGQVGQAQSVGASSITVDSVQLVAADDPAVADAALPAGSTAVLANVSLDIEAEAVCAVSLRGDWQGHAAQWVQDWSITELSFCVSGAQESGLMGFVVPADATNLRIVLVVDGVATAVAVGDPS